jgi:hypothetical protein
MTLNGTSLTRHGFLRGAISDASGWSGGEAAACDSGFAPLLLVST